MTLDTTAGFRLSRQATGRGRTDSARAPVVLDIIGVDIRQCLGIAAALVEYMFHAEPSS